jgi:CDP-glucose 4,6-dehydratase
VLVASSDKAYGTQPVLPYTEEASLRGQFPYDVSKSCADLLAQAYFQTYKLPVCVTRCGNLYGPGDRNFDRLIPGTIRSIALGEQPVIRSDGKFIRDYFFVPDAVDGYLTIAENMHRPEVVGQAFNLSTMNKVSVLDLFNKMISLMSKNVTPLVLNQASNEIREQYLSSQKAEKLLGWRPRHTLDEGLRITIAWYMRYFGKDMESRNVKLQTMLKNIGEQ